MSFDYFLKLVPTLYRPLGRDPEHPFQFGFSAKGHNTKKHPGVAFHFDFSPMTVEYAEKHQHLYEFLGRTVAYVGGCFTVAGMVDSIVYSTSAAFKKYDIGKVF